MLIFVRKFGLSRPCNWFVAARDALGPASGGHATSTRHDHALRNSVHDPSDFGLVYMPCYWTSRNVILKRKIKISYNLWNYALNKIRWSNKYVIKTVRFLLLLELLYHFIISTDFLSKALRRDTSHYFITHFPIFTYTDVKCAR